MFETLNIRSSQGEYEVILQQKLENLIEALSGYSQSVVVMDQKIAELYPQLRDKLNHHFPLFLIEAAEEVKTLAGSEKVLHFFSENHVKKSTTVIAVGGGIIQDLVSFAAHIYYRGLAFVYVPTTLLAMSDSCIGAKCGLNYRGFKNQIGAFHPPQKVFICLAFLQTLSYADLYSGYGEIFKLSLIGAQQDYSYESLKNIFNKEGLKNCEIFTHILESLRIKKGFIEQDEFDTGIRRILNYGHTFGHALELATHYVLPHGIAVVHGIDIANYIACCLNVLNKEIYRDIHSFIKRHFQQKITASLTGSILISHAKKDKKNKDNKLNMVLLQTPGRLILRELAFDEQLQSILDKYLAENAEFF